MSPQFLLIDKPAGITSHDVVDRVRRKTGERRVGHAGTLDPFATGLLIVGVGREATRELDQYVGLDKTYEAEFVLGATTQTLDPESAISRDETFRADKVTRSQIVAAMATLTGPIAQIPPMHSAIKVKGKKLYELARKGIEIEREPRAVTIHAFDLVAEPRVEDGLLVLQTRIRCSSGTYVRAMARDLGEALGTKGYVRTLRRTAIGDHSVAKATLI